MNKRQFLGAIGATTALVVAGCVGDDGASNGTDDDGETATDTEFSVTPASVDDDRPISHSVSVAGGGYDDSEGPLTLTVELTNTSEESLAYGERRAALFEGAGSDDGRFSLYPGSWDDFDETQYEFENCWNRTEPYVTTADYQIGNLDAGQSHETAVVLAASAQEKCPESTPDELTFSNVTNVSDSDSTTDEGTEYEWSFRLTQN